jgi:CcmD family protein
MITDPATNLELYKLVAPDMPYVIAAYAILWIALITYVSFVLARLMKLEKEILIVEESCGRRERAGE